MSARDQIPLLRDDEVARLDAAQDALLAPVRGEDRRGTLPREYFEKKPGRFLAKFLSTLVLIAASWTLIALEPGLPATLAAAALAGLMYAHLVELQHECLHEHAFHSRTLNRLCGVISGTFMLSSFWHYKHDHLRHHAFLGTPQNQEFFNYRFRDLHRWYGLGFVLAALHPGRYANVARDLVLCCLGRPVPGVVRELDARKIRAEYRLLAVLLAGAIAFSVLTGDLLLLWVWLLPTLLVSEPAHFLIEMPEHFGLNTQSDPNVLTNTRTIRASRPAQWFTNYNNLHTAHHYHQGVPMAQAVRLHALIADRVVPTEESYWSFYRSVLTGRIRYRNEDETCMTR
ncbi:fatty acid desaturase [Streptomyces sp. W16]|uniref:fatty acid desaturase family protein n=1 Tax=Streptomyces sp. W16 TaxID=3076631 RepID=UPI00295B517B|nr:fatty acid desaturase [Streptomyces sp. W16]MDV9171381.1 fatty acid desaturase [Streptomyces sp. W16]